MAIYRTRNGNTEKVSNREMKKTIMAVNKWTAERYQKEYDMFKNRLRAYESYQEAHGSKVSKQSPAELLYKQAKTKQKYGSDYKPSNEMTAIRSFPAYSITKGRKLAKDLNNGYSMARQAALRAKVLADFDEFIQSVPKAQELVDGIQDAVKLKAALADLAKHIHKNQETAMKSAKESGSPEVIFAGEAYGSDPMSGGYDIGRWLD